MGINKGDLDGFDVDYPPPGVIELYRYELQALYRHSWNRFIIHVIEKVGFITVTIHPLMEEIENDPALERLYEAMEEAEANGLGGITIRAV